MKKATHITKKFEGLASHSPGYVSLLLDIVDNDDYDKWYSTCVTSGVCLFTLSPPRTKAWSHLSWHNANTTHRAAGRCSIMNEQHLLFMAAITYEEGVFICICPIIINGSYMNPLPHKRTYMFRIIPSIVSHTSCIRTQWWCCKTSLSPYFQTSICEERKCT